MDIRRFLQTSEGRITITNVGNFLKEPTHDDISRAPGLMFCNVQPPVTNEPRYNNSIQNINQIISKAKCTKRNTYSFPDDPRHMFEIKNGGEITAAPSYKIWRADFTDDGLILQFIDSIYVPSQSAPSIMGEVTINVEYMVFDIIVNAYDDFPKRKYSCAALTDHNYPEIKQRKLQSYVWDNEKEKYTESGSIDFYKNLIGESAFNISCK